ncbi:MAG TPA: aminotransferase class I/II-fold pyridoxal phosphate-dependent enzyme [Candidatus Binataceae bacterium]|nr:aminotransferase class I/II-fold pyridoxal phosphate-dependent enzyme [Candidatus Binataceae bacterium]
MNVSVRYQIRGQSSNAIAASIEDAIHAGRLATGEQLPTVRDLARRLHVSPTTVNAAYNALRVRGLVRGAGRRGTVVNRRPPLLTPADASPPPGVRNLAEGGPDPKLLPPLGPAISALDADPGRYGDTENLPELVEAARKQFREDGIAVDSIAVVSGALDGIERVLSSYLSPGDVVALEDPSYTGVLDLIASLGLIAEPVAMDEFGMLPRELDRALKAKAKACIVTPRAQNPTGAALDRKRAMELQRVLARHPGVVVIEDDHAGPVAGAPALTTTAGLERWAIVRSVSKSLGPDLRLATLIGDARTVARVEGRLRIGPRWVSRILQRIVVNMWSEPKTWRAMKHAADTYAERRRAMIAALNTHGIEAYGRSGLNVWIPVAEETAIVQALARKRWAVRAGEIYRIKSAPGIRITVASLEPAEAVRIAADFAASLRPQSHARLA